ncbi:MAG: response regulator transcription factor [Chloroflexota bacterium]
MRVLLVDDHRLVVEGLTNLLTAHGIEVVAAAHDGWEALAAARLSRPDVILMDIRMPRCDGLAATRLIKAQMPEMKIVMLTTSAEDDDLFEAIKSGACGYLLKSVSGQQFAESLLGLEQGIPPFSPGLAGKILREFARQAGAENAPAPAPATTAPPASEATAELTARQTDVLKAVAEGLTYKEVGVKLALSERTVRYHMAEIMDRLHLEHRSQVIAFAGQMGLGPEKG